MCKFVSFIKAMDYQELYNQNKERLIKGRYIALHHLEPVLLRLQNEGKVSVLGRSVLGKPIYVYQNGKGNIRVMMWSQMHGNESTTTKAVLDFFNFLDSEKGEEFKQRFTFCIIPMLNPDGAEKWIRTNANDVDLNRDSQNLTQPESQILRKCIEDFKPDLCFNLHDQRTIFGVEGTQNPATVSFLAPSYNEAKEVNDVRKKAMEVIAYMNETLQKYIPNQIGRYDDSFNINCIGDTVQQIGIPTVLIEAGHYPSDYQRENTRKLVFTALVSGLYNFKLKCVFDEKHLEYFNIPHNLAFFFDFLYKNVKFNYDNKQIITNFAVQFSERVENEEIAFDAFISKVGDLPGVCGHFEFDAKGEKYSDNENNFPNIGQKADFFIGNQKFLNGKPLTIGEE